jgi:aspartyl aminopeptidase
MPNFIEDVRDFLDQSPTAWHAVQKLSDRLTSLRVKPLDETKKWKLEKGKRYFVQRGGSLCMFTLPKKTPQRMAILGAHTDSPALKLKPNPEIISGSMHLLETEVYGAPLLNSWLNRDLAIAGRIVTDQMQEHLVFLEQTPLFIPQLALHLDREVNDKGLVIDKQDHLKPVFSLKGKGPLLESLLKKHVKFKELLAFDLFLVPIEKSRLLGLSGEMIASYRLDNLASAHACATAFAQSKPADHLQIVALWDGEEIGSRTTEGAASPFVEDMIKRISTFYGMNEEEFICMKNNSLCVSVDVAHAYNPNFSKKYDPEHRLLPGEGIALKYNSDKKYATDAKTAAPIMKACKKLKLKTQSFSSRSDIPSGSTIGPIFAHSLGIPTVDIGSPIFSMHSAREVLAVQDHLDLCHLLTHLLDEK